MLLSAIPFRHVLRVWRSDSFPLYFTVLEIMWIGVASDCGCGQWGVVVFLLLLLVCVSDSAAWCVLNEEVVGATMLFLFFFSFVIDATHGCTTPDDTK